MLRRLLLAVVLAGSAVATDARAAAAAPTPLTVAQLSHRLTAEVVGYLPYWELTSPTTLAELQYRRLSTITLFSVGVRDDGHLDPTAPGYAAIVSATATSVIEAAHAEGVRVIVSFTSFGSTHNAAFFSNAAARSTFVNEAAAFVASRGLDGADFDVELISSTYFDAYAATAGALATRLRSANPIAFTTVATSASSSGTQMAAKALAAGVGRAFLMGYDYRTNATSVSGSIDPLVRAGSGLSLTQSLDNYAAAGVPMGRVILGLPLYGRTWPTVSTAVRAAVVPNKDGEVFRIRQLDELRSRGTVLMEDLDTVETSARLVYDVAGVTWQAYYDSPATFVPRFALVFSRGLAGTGFWALGYDRNPAIWDLVGKTFGPPSLTSVSIVPSPSNRTVITVSIGWSDRDRPAIEMRLANGSGAFSAWRPIAATTSWTLPGSSVPITRDVRVQIRDDHDAQSPIVTGRVLYDPTKPVMTTLTASWSASAGAWLVKYAASDTGSGVASYRIRIDRGSSLILTLRGRTATSFLLRLPSTAHFRVTVDAQDRAGNVSAPRSISR
jgi:spore germination protein YaaH